MSFSVKLLDYEPRAGDQVPLLMSMQEDELALVKAIESGDTDLGKQRHHCTWPTVIPWSYPAYSYSHMFSALTN